MVDFYGINVGMDQGRNINNNIPKTCEDDKFEPYFILMILRLAVAFSSDAMEAGNVLLLSLCLRLWLVVACLLLF